MKPARLPAPIAALGQHPDVLLAVGVAAIIAMLIMPLPSFLLDGLLATNLAFAAVILVAVLLSQRPLSISTFPTLLLITTLFRLSLNVSTTRMILAQGTAGDVVKAFGQFVIQGDVIVGVVIFLVITLVQLLVIGKGAERVAEVGARFTLDAMPGKQMSIDAAVRSGSIEEEEGQAKRDELARESQFYGAMDGAMKFVKGDAVAGLIITALNLVAGLVIGVMRNGMDLATAAETYTILTIGDGLVSQLPALLITLAAGVLTTRVAAKDATSSLGANLKDELFSSPKVLVIGGAFALALGLIPGLPLLPFAFIASALAAAAYFRNQALVRRDSITRDVGGDFKKQLQARADEAKEQEAIVDSLAPCVSPLGIDCDPRLSRFLELERNGECVLVARDVTDVRNHIYMEAGVRIPPAVVRRDVTTLRSYEFCIRIKDVPVYSGRIEPDLVMVLASPEDARRLGVEVTVIRHPINGREVCLVPKATGPMLSAAGYRTWSPSEIIALHFLREVRKQATMFVGLQEAGEMVQRLEKVCPVLVKEVVPRLVSLTQLTDILRRLVDERISIRDLKTILECLAEAVEFETDRVQLTERVRAALSLQIAHKHGALGGPLKCLVVDGLIEDTIQAAVLQVPGGTCLALDPELQQSILAATTRAMHPVVQAEGTMPVVVTHPGIRRYLQKLLESYFPGIVVLSFNELPQNSSLTPLGRITMIDELAA